MSMLYGQKLKRVQRRSTFASSTPKVLSAFQKLKEAKVADNPDIAKKSYNKVVEELKGKPNRRKRTQNVASSYTGETSDRTEVVVVPVKQSPWSKKWESVKEKGKIIYSVAC